VRCHARERERQLGTGYGFGIFLDQELAGEINLNAIQRGPFQNAYIGYWVDEAKAGRQPRPRSRRGADPLRLRGAAASTACRSPSSPATRGAAA
jgi:ribosomal-protein-alanine N-acetyltransferase